MNISYSFGIIDLFHYGHLCALQKASVNSDYHVFGLVSDEAATTWQGNIVSSEQERRAVLESIRFIDKVIPQKTFDPTENIRQLHELYPDANITLYHGSDMTVIPAELYLKSIGGTVEIIDYYDKMSPIRILEALTSDSSKKTQSSNIISTKANTLIALKSRLKRSIIEDIYVCTVEQYKTDYDSVFREIQKRFGGKQVVVRSSSKNEDCYESSNAGHYESVLGIASSDYAAVKRALDTVGQSYEKDGEAVGQEQILIQSQTPDVIYSGVVFTRDIQNNRPYYVVNYDDCGKTDCVTSGAGGKSVWIARDTEDTEIPSQWVKLISSVKEIEDILNGALLDIEFAIKTDGTVVIFQTRPLAANYKYSRNKRNELVLDIKSRTIAEYQEFRNERRYLLSDMAFWNPAEIIGTNPHPLDYSLYREIITHKAWNQGLVEMGYTEVDDDLMYRFGNKPYICIDYAFRSLLPSELDEDLAERLVDFYRLKLAKDYTAHDKIEFEIVLSCFDFATEDKLVELRSEGFTDEDIFELRRALFDLTYKCIRNYPVTLQKDLSDLETLENIRGEVETQINVSGYDTVVYVHQIQRLLAAIEQYGTPQFSRQARCAFMAKALCRSLVTKGYITENEQDDFMSTISTVARQFEMDYNKMLVGELALEDFNKTYGHLRAGTYDIRSQRYENMNIEAGTYHKEGFSEYKTKELPQKGLETALREIGMSIRSSELDVFLRKAIEQREYFKFIFTRTLSRVIEMVAEIGSHLGFDRNQMSYLEIPQILSLQFYDDSKSMKDYMKALIKMHREKYGENQELILPEVITKAADLNVVNMVDSRPNFVTLKSVHAPVTVLEENLEGELTGRIVVVEKADPGFDWIFAKGIAGLVTKYGGAASHMAIRCAEFGIPAAIGCGERIFDFVKGNKEITIDCKKGKILGGFI